MKSLEWKSPRVHLGLLFAALALVQSAAAAENCEKQLQKGSADFQAGNRTAAETDFRNAAFDGCSTELVALAKASKDKVAFTHDVLKGGAYSGDLELQKNYAFFLLAKQDEASKGGPPLQEPNEEIYAFASIIAARGETWAANYVSTLDKLMPPSANYVEKLHTEKVRAKIAEYQAERAK